MMTDSRARTTRGASDGRVSWAIPVSSRSHLCPSLSSVHPSIPPSRRAMSGISLDGTCLKISSVINPRPGPQAATSRAGLTVAATISIAYLVFSLSLPVSTKCACAGPRLPRSQTAGPVTDSASGNVGSGDLFSLIRNIHACGARTGCKQPGPHTPGGQERSSVAEARECLGAQGPGQEVRRRRFAETKR